MNENILEINNLRTYFPVIKGLFRKVTGYIKAVDDISLVVKKGTSFGLVGESGSGKTTLGRSILNLVKPDSGHITFNDLQIDFNNNLMINNLRRKVQIVFQDPFSSLNPRKTIGSMLIEPLLFHKIKNKKQAIQSAKQTLLSVGLTDNDFYKYPHEFSGGQRQRIGIARALILEPELIILDEPVSSLDVSVQAQILTLLKELQDKYNLTFLFIAHNLSVVRFFCERIAVMYLGKIMEIADTEELFNNARHPYTRLLLSSIPEVNKKKNIIDLNMDKEPASLLKVTQKCRFLDRCPESMNQCQGDESQLKEVGKDHYVRCYL